MKSCIQYLDTQNSQNKYVYIRIDHVYKNDVYELRIRPTLDGYEIELV